MKLVFQHFNCLGVQWKPFLIDESTHHQRFWANYDAVCVKRLIFKQSHLLIQYQIGFPRCHSHCKKNCPFDNALSPESIIFLEQNRKRLQNHDKFSVTVGDYNSAVCRTVQNLLKKERLSVKSTSKSKMPMKVVILVDHNSLIIRRSEIIGFLDCISDCDHLESTMRRNKTWSGWRNRNDLAKMNVRTSV